MWKERFGNPLVDAETFKINKNSYLTEIGRKPRTIKEIEGQYMGVIFFKPSGWKKIRGLISKHRFLIDLSITELLSFAIRNNIKIKAIKYDNLFYEIDTNTDLKVMRKKLKNETKHKYNIKKKNYIILDFGTATTFDVIIKNNYYGGIIAPGINLSIKSLKNNASLIPNFTLQKVRKVIGKNTLSALRSGFFWGYTGLINNIIKLIKIETKKNFKIIATGGYSHLFKSSLDYKVSIDKDITIKGCLLYTSPSPRD